MVASVWGFLSCMQMLRRAVAQVGCTDTEIFCFVAQTNSLGCAVSWQCPTGVCVCAVEEKKEEKKEESEESDEDMGFGEWWCLTVMKTEKESCYVGLAWKKHFRLANHGGNLNTVISVNVMQTKFVVTASRDHLMVSSPWSHQFHWTGPKILYVIMMSDISKWKLEMKMNSFKMKIAFSWCSHK